MAETEECAQRACFRIADVTVIHSVTTRATGLTATVMGRGLKLAIVSWSVDATWSSPSLLDMATSWRSRSVYATRLWYNEGAVRAAGTAVQWFNRLYTGHAYFVKFHSS